MNIPDFIDLATDIEVNVSGLYNAVAANTSDRPIAQQLEQLADEELKHANILRTGKSYYQSMPDLFTGLTMDESEAREGLKGTEALQTLFSQKRTSLLTQLQSMLEFERRFERIHMGASVKIENESMKQLFVGLSRGDHSHITLLKALIDMLQERT
jgi:rubrerythrin